MLNRNKIRVGIVGANPSRGFASIAHIPALQALPDFEISAVCSPRVLRARRAPAGPAGMARRGTARRRSAAANDDACALLRSSGDRCFVFTLDCRVQDLKDVEDSHRNVVDQVGQGARHADKSYLAGLSEPCRGWSAGAPG
jgi:hypothetical protein